MRGFGVKPVEGAFEQQHRITSAALPAQRGRTDPSGIGKDSGIATTLGCGDRCLGMRAEEKAAKAVAEAEAAKQERVMAVALEAASVAHDSARRTPAERQAYTVADMIRQFGEETVTISYIRRALNLPHSTAQDRRDRARQILAQGENAAAA